MTHLLLFNGQLACGASLGPWSNFIQLVDCEKCLAWHKANDFAKSLVTITLLDYDPTWLKLVSSGCGPDGV